jgi:hypothetical protein
MVSLVAMRFEVALTWVSMSVLGCAAGDRPSDATPVAEVTAAPSDSGPDRDEGETNGLVVDAIEPVDAAEPLAADAACAATAATAKTEILPVDIIWVVDNSSSMAPAVAEIRAGLNAFASVVAGKGLDYKVIVLSLRNKTSPVAFGGSTRYPICIPAPLAGDDDCGNGPRFFHANLDVRSTQVLEQILGTLDQTDCYRRGQERGSEPWKAELRPEATKTFVVVTDDNSRLSATEFETFAGGKNPFNACTLPVGLRDPSRGGMFDGYVFGGLYGWGADADPSATCRYPDGTMPANAGVAYTTLVKKTGGPRAKICDGSAAWGPFFDAVATAVAKSAKLACELTIPLPESGTLDPAAVNVAVLGGGSTLIPKVAGAADCGTTLGWYYDDDTTPTKVVLCPAACDEANSAVGIDKPGKIDIQFGCKTVIR